MQIIMVIRRLQLETPKELPKCYYKFIPKKNNNPFESNESNGLSALDEQVELMTKPHKMKGEYIYDEKADLWYNPNIQWYYNENTHQYAQNINGPWLNLVNGKLRRV